MIRETLVLLAHELRLGLTNRRLLLAAGIVVLGAVLVTTTAINVAKSQGVAAITAFGQLTQQGHQNAAQQRKVKKALRAFLGRKADIVEYRLETPLLLTFVFVMVVLFFPFVVALLAYDAIAREIQAGAIRFLLPRARRVSIVLGKFGAQAITLLVLIATGFLCVVLSGAYALEGPLLAWLRESLSMAVLAWLMSLGYLAWCLFASSLVRRPFVSLMIAVVGLLAMGILGLTRWGGASPNAYKIDLLGPPAMAGQAAAVFLGFALVMLALSMIVLQARDL